MSHGSTTSARRAGTTCLLAAVLTASLATVPLTATAAPTARTADPGAGDSTTAVADAWHAPIDLATAGVPEVQAGLTAGDFTSVSLTRAYLTRIDALSTNGPHLNSVLAVNPQALAEAAALDAERAAGTVRGPLHGVTVIVKDNIDVAGMPTTAGSVALADSYPAADAPLIARLREAGAIILGKANLTEFANFMTSGMPAGYSSLGGQVLNPYDLSQSPSGSSSGPGSAAAAGLATLTIGTETSGSILSPARANSLAAVKPTVGLVPRTGVVPISATQDTAGPMVRSVYDAAALLTAITGVDPEDPWTAANPSVGVDFTAGLSDTALQGARLGVVTGETDATDAVWTEALATLEAQGATLVPVTLGGTTAPSILVEEFERDLNSYLARLPEDAPMDTLTDIVEYNAAHPEEALKFGQTLLVASEAVDLTDPAQLATYEANLQQGLTESRAAIDTVLAGDDLDAIVSNSRTTGLAARAGYPSVIVPAGYAPTNRRPSSVVFTGTAWSEQTLLALGYDFEQAADAWLPPEVVNPSAFRCTSITPTTEWDASCADDPNAQPFLDVTPQYVFADDIRWMYEYGLSTGTVVDGGRYFYPLDAVSRQAMAAFLYRASGTTWTPADGTQTFADVPATHPFYAAIEWMAAEGLASGYPAPGKPVFGSALPVSRQAMAAFLWRTEGSPEPAPVAGPVDVPAGSPFDAAIRWMTGAGISTGYSDGTYRPTEPVSRQATAAFLHRSEG
ncbi:amidase family protein [uncultured Cellulomonas sp.]|uniref:amidase family protein n=1 Tax=uncultured Cellulomonas sp. TaxID=189682 RepID=UPI002610C515|nr:amidase family protein [uncultured Cellulomonas sp.]